MVDPGPTTVEIIEVKNTVEIIANPNIIQLLEVEETIDLVEDSQVDIVSIGTQGPQGISQQEEQLNQDKETEILDDTPSAGDTTIYEGYYVDPTAQHNEAKFKIFKTFIPANGVGGYRRVNEEGGYTYSQIWNNRASLTY